jgi:hypothetical protein
MTMENKEIKQISYNDLQVAIVREIRAWRDGLIENYGKNSTISEIDAGDACELASQIAYSIYPGVEVVGPMESHRKLSEGWDGD